MYVKVVENEREAEPGESKREEDKLGSKKAEEIQEVSPDPEEERKMTGEGSDQVQKDKEKTYADGSLKETTPAPPDMSKNDTNKYIKEKDADNKKKENEEAENGSRPKL